MFYLTTHSTHFIYGYMVSDMVKDHSGRKERFYLTMHSTHFIYGYMASDMVKDHSGRKEMFYLTMHLLHIYKILFLQILNQTR